MKGTGDHVRQVILDRHQVTVCNSNRNKIKVGTWNVRTLYQAGKLENVIQEMRRLDINIFGLCETRWTNSGSMQIDDYKIIYSGGDKHEKGVGIILDKERSKSLMGYWAISDRVLLVKLKGHPFNISIIQAYAPTSASTEDDIEAFYETLEKAKDQCKSQYIIIMMGDFNARVGKQHEGHIVGEHGPGIRNERGETFVRWCQANEQVITNTWFEQHPRQPWTWMSPVNVTKNQIDYITINNRFRNSVQQSKSYPGADCGSDHNPVICKLKVRLKKLKMIKREQQLDYCQLQNNQDIKNTYAIEVNNRFSVLEQEGNNTTLEVFKEALVETAKETIPKKTKQSKNKRMTEEILRMMRNRQAIPQRNSDEYKQLHREIRKKCREAKEEWLKNECAEIEKGKETDTKAMHKRIQDLTGAKTCSSSGCIRSKDGTIITEKDDILERWTEYIEELFRDNRGGKPEIRKNIDGPKILQSEIRAAVSRMKGNKARGPDGIVIEMIKALDDFGIEKLTIMTNEIYDTGKIPQDLSKSIFIALPKKPGTIECELHRTISIMSHITKVILRVIMKRARRCTKPEISQEQCGLVEDTGTRNAIFIFRTLCERAIEVQHDLYLCFIDYAKAFDKVKHEDLFEFLQNLDIDGKDLRLIRNLYWEQSAAIRIDGNMRKYTQIRRGVRQGCVFSPDLFNLYSEIILRDQNDTKGCIVGGYNLNNVRYADDAVLIAGSESQLQELLNSVVDSSLHRGLSINIKKTQCMVISKTKITHTGGSKLVGSDHNQRGRLISFFYVNWSL